MLLNLQEDTEILVYNEHLTKIGLTHIKKEQEIIKMFERIKLNHIKKLLNLKHRINNTN